MIAYAFGKLFLRLGYSNKEATELLLGALEANRPSMSLDELTLTLVGFAFLGENDARIWENSEARVMEFETQIDLENCLKLGYAFALVDRGSAPFWESLCEWFLAVLEECSRGDLEQMAWILAKQQKAGEQPELWKQLEKQVLVESEKFQALELALLLANFGSAGQGTTAIWKVLDEKCDIILESLDVLKFLHFFSCVLKSAKRLQKSTLERLCSYVNRNAAKFSDSQKEALFADLLAENLLTPELQQVFKGVQSLKIS